MDEDMDLPDHLEKIVSEMRSGDLGSASAAVLVTRDADSGLLFIHQFGHDSKLLKEAYEITRPNA